MGKTQVSADYADLTQCSFSATKLPKRRSLPSLRVNTEVLCGFANKNKYGVAPLQLTNGYKVLKKKVMVPFKITAHKDSNSD
jgi:hypothetical protein